MALPDALAVFHGIDRPGGPLGVQPGADLFDPWLPDCCPLGPEGDLAGVAVGGDELVDRVDGLGDLVGQGLVHGSQLLGILLPSVGGELLGGVQDQLLHFLQRGRRRGRHWRRRWLIQRCNLPHVRSADDHHPGACRWAGSEDDGHGLAVTAWGEANRKRFPGRGSLLRAGGEDPAGDRQQQDHGQHDGYEPLGTHQRVSLKEVRDSRLGTEGLRGQ